MFGATCGAVQLAWAELARARAQASAVTWFVVQAHVQGHTWRAAAGIWAELSRARAQASAITWFVVQARLGELAPYAVRHAVLPLPGAPGAPLAAALRGVVDMFEGDLARTDLAGPWRPFAALAGGAPVGGPLTRVRTRVPPLAPVLAPDTPS